MPVVCSLEDINPESGKEGWVDGGKTWVMLCARDGKVLAYNKAWPHQGRAMNFAPDRFILSKEGQLVCPHHGATFELASGLCVAGPCKGSSLKAVAARVVDGEVLI